MDENRFKMSREELYSEIWELSVSGVSKKYNVPYSSLMKLCKENSIPTPPAGYWTSLSFGKQVEKIKLPESSVSEVILLDNSKPKQSNHPKVQAANTKEAIAVPLENEKPGKSDRVQRQEPDFQVINQPVRGVKNTYNREKLYEEVWSKPVVDVAVHYGVSDVAIHKICRALNVPVPPRGYWAKIRAGDKIKKEPLPATKGVIDKVGQRTYEAVKTVIPPEPSLSFLEEEERQKVLFAAREISLLPQEAKLHKKIAAYRSVVKEWNHKDYKPEGAQRNYQSNYQQPPFLAGVISSEALPRVYRILDALYRKVEQLGGIVNDDLSLQIRNENVRLVIIEDQTQIKHELTKQEARDLIIYKDEKRHGGWASKPQIRKYDYIFNGHLKVGIRKHRYVRDSDSLQIESRLGEMLLELYEESQVVRTNREAYEEATRKREEEARQKEERRNKYNLEVDRTIGLQNAANDYDTACKIRAYLRAIEKSIDVETTDEEQKDWLEWAYKKSDWFDPTVARTDEVFGMRKHEESQEQKTLKKAGHYGY